MKKFVALLLAMSLCLGLLATTAFGEETIKPALIVYEDYRVVYNGELKTGVAQYKMTNSEGTLIDTLKMPKKDGYLPEANYSTWKEKWENNGKETITTVVDGERDVKVIFWEVHKNEHKYGEWIDAGDGTHSATCSVCGETKTEKHDAYLEWKRTEDEQKHYQECSVCHYKTTATDHTGMEDGVCDDCQYAEDFTVTFDVQGGTPEVEPQTVKCGDTLTEPKPAPTKEGFTLEGWYSAAENGEKYDFSKPVDKSKTPKTLFANWIPEEKPPVEETKYEVTVTIKGDGKVTGAPTGKITEKTPVTLVANPDDGCEFVSMTSDDVEIKVDKDAKTGTFEMPAKNVNVTVTFTSKPSGSSGSGGGSSKPSIKPGTTTTPTDPVPNPGDQTGTGTVAGFSDVSASAWYADAVKYVVDRGLFGGVGNGRFAPDANMTRAMMWTVLARYKGVDTNTGSNWYEAARTWAMQQNISDGTMADGNVTREQFVTMLWRLSGEPAATNSASFTDNGRVSSYAQNAVNWAVAQGIVNGYNDGSFRPQGSATRAEVAKMLMVFCVTSEG